MEKTTLTKPISSEMGEVCFFYSADCRLCQHLLDLKKKDGPVITSGTGMALRIAPTGGAIKIFDSQYVYAMQRNIPLHEFLKAN